MYIKIDKKKILEHLPVLVFLWYGFTIGWEGKIDPSTEYYVNRVLYVVSICILLYIGKKRRSILSMMLPLMMASVILFFDNANIANNYTILVWSGCSIMLFFCAGNNSNMWHTFFLKALLVIGAFYAITTLQSMIDANFFLRVCVPFFQHYGYAAQMIGLYNKGYITGFSPHYSITAMYLAVTFGAPLAYAFASGFKNKKMNILALAILVSVLVTGKRAHSIFIIAVTMVIYLLVHCDEPVKRWEKILLIIIVAALVFTVASQFVPQLMNVVNRFAETKEAGDVEMGRGQTRAVALGLWLENPLFGIGWDGFKYFYKGIVGKELNIHCVYVQLLCEVGIIGALPFYTFFISSVIKAITLLRRYILDKENDTSKFIVLIYSVFIQMFFLLYCVTGNPLYDNPTLFTYMIGCTMGEYYWLNRKERA